VLLLEKPLTEFLYDTDPKQSAQSRVKMLGMLADQKILLLAYHFPWPGIGHVARQGEGFRYYIEDSDLNGIVKIMTGNTDPASIAKFRYGSGMLVHMMRGKGEVVTAATCEWVMGLKRNCPFTTQITRNILDRFAGG